MVYIYNEPRGCLNCKKPLAVGKITKPIADGLYEVEIQDFCVRCKCVIRKIKQHENSIHELKNKLYKITI